MKKKILVSGDSTTNHIFYNTPTPPHDHYPWPYHIDEKYDVTNIGQGGAGTLYVATSIMNELHNNPNDYDLIIIEWPDLYRFYNIFDKQFSDSVVIEKNGRTIRPHTFDISFNSKTNDIPEQILWHKPLDASGLYLDILEIPEVNKWWNCIPPVEFTGEYEFNNLIYMHSVIEYLKNIEIPFFMFWGFSQIHRNSLYQCSRVINDIIDWEWFLWYNKESNTVDGNMYEWTVNRRNGKFTVAPDDEHLHNESHRIFTKEIIEPKIKELIG